MRSSIAVTLALLALGGPIGAKAGVVETESGRVRGTSTSGVESFLGIPYAAPPVGNRRWRAPAPAAPWRGIRSATAIGPDCMQARANAEDRRALSEDCLTINLWRPAAPGKRLPVLVWIHGGGFVAGGSSDPQTWGEQFARRGILLVTFNYRLGRLGFFAHPALGAEPAAEPKGNYGYLDQIAALRWVKRNVARFGGDPAAVTVMGESAGGESVLTLAGSAMASGLFARAIVQSGGGREPLLGRRLMRQDLDGRVSAEQAGLNFARANGIAGTGVSDLAALRALPAEQVNARLTMASLLFGELARFSGPIEDGQLVQASPGKALAARRKAIPLLIGTTDADLGFNLAGTKDSAFAQFGSAAAAARAMYDPAGTTDLSLINTRIGADRIMQEPARYVARLVAAKRAPAWRFRFSYVATALRGKPTPGAEHATDVAYVFSTLPAQLAGRAGPTDLAVSDVINRYWVNFVRTGNPNGPGLPAWPGAAGDSVMVFRADGRAAAGPDSWKPRLDLAQARAETPAR